MRPVVFNVVFVSQLCSLCGVDLVGLSAMCTADGFIPVESLKGIPAIVEACRVPGALLTALQRSQFVEVRPTRVLRRPSGEGVLTILVQMFAA